MKKIGSAAFHGGDHMKVRLFFDEDVHAGLADALNLGDIDTVHIQGLKHTGLTLIGKGTQARQERAYVDGHHTG